MFKIDRTLAAQVVNTVKDVCGRDVNFINQYGIIFASTDPERVGTFHEIGHQAALTGETIEVRADDNFHGTRMGINLSLIHIFSKAVRTIANGLFYFLEISVNYSSCIGDFSLYHHFNFLNFLYFFTLTNKLSRAIILLTKS